MNRLTSILLLLIFLPQPVTGVISFEPWLSVDELVFVVGKPVFLNVYINNTGDEEDSYNLTDVRIVNVDNPNLVSVVLLRELTDTVRPGEIATIPVRIRISHLLKRSEGARIEFSIKSTRDPTVQNQASLSISSGIPESLTELNNFHLFLSLLLSFLILIRKFS